MPSPSALAGSGISTSGGTSQPSSSVSPTAGSSVPSGTAAGTAHNGLAAASALCNLLSQGGGSLAPGGLAGVVFGEGLPPVPLKLAKKIRRWEFIDMAELLPEHWGQVPGGKPDDEQGGQRPPSSRKRKVTDIVSWSQCFAIYVGILAGTSPGSVPELLAYMVHMLQVSRSRNENRCTFPRCRYQHVCRICGGPKPDVECCERAMPSSSTPRWVASQPRSHGTWQGCTRRSSNSELCVV